MKTEADGRCHYSARKRGVIDRTARDTRWPAGAEDNESVLESAAQCLDEWAHVRPLEWPAPPDKGRGAPWAPNGLEPPVSGGVGGMGLFQDRQTEFEHRSEAFGDRVEGDWCADQVDHAGFQYAALFPGQPIGTCVEAGDPELGVLGEIEPGVSKKHCDIRRVHSNRNVSLCVSQCIDRVACPAARRPIRFVQAGHNMSGLELIHE